VNQRQFGLAIIRAYHHAANRVPLGRLEAAYIRPAFFAGQAISLAERMRSQGDSLNGQTVENLAHFLGISPFELRQTFLPILKRAGIIDYVIRNDEVLRVEEFVGVSAPLLVQTAQVFDEFGPRDVDRALVLSGQLAAHAPMVESNHIQAIISGGIEETDALEGLKAAAAVHLVRRQASRELNENIIYNEHVWSTGVVPISGFLRQLPSTERAVILGIVDAAATSPGIALPSLSASTANPGVLTAARKVGLIDTARVKSKTGQQQVYAFSPLLERDLAARNTTDALHERKLFVAHILFGHQFGAPATGRINDPVVLVNALLRKGEVGPATAITNDYLLLESFGILRAVPYRSGMSTLKLIKEDVVRDGLGLLQKTLGASDRADASPEMAGLWLPGSFVPPEEDRRLITEGDSPEANELFEGVVRRLHDSAAKVTRGEEF
jgi:hypothetical protein